MKMGRGSQHDESAGNALNKDCDRKGNQCDHRDNTVDLVNGHLRSRVLPRGFRSATT